MNRFFLLAACALLSGCASTSVMQTSANTAEITVDAAPVCGTTGAQKVAYEDAAIETLRAGFDRFIIGADAGASNLSGAVTGADVTGSPYQSSGISSTTFLFHHHERLFIHMFRPGDAGYDDAVDARSVLGPRWEAKVRNGPPRTC